MSDPRIHNWNDPTIVDIYIPVENFSSALRAMIAIKQLSSEEVGNRIGVAHSTVRFWCVGRMFPRKENLTKLCEFLEMDEDIVKILIEQEKKSKEEKS